MPLTNKYKVTGLKYKGSYYSLRKFVLIIHEVVLLVEVEVAVGGPLLLGRHLQAPVQDSGQDLVLGGFGAKRLKEER
jgi:hypothetical protein